MADRARDPVVVQFGCNTPFWPLSMTYGIFLDTESARWFMSLDHWVGFHMLRREEDRREIIGSPNGWIARQNLLRITRNARGLPGMDVVRDDWEERRDAIMARGVGLKVGQHAATRDLLLRTRGRRILDESRVEDDYWCNARGRGRNRHGHILEQCRDALVAEIGDRT